MSPVGKKCTWVLGLDGRGYVGFKVMVSQRNDTPDEIIASELFHYKSISGRCPSLKLAATSIVLSQIAESGVMVWHYISDAINGRPPGTTPSAAARKARGAEAAAQLDPQSSSTPTAPKQRSLVLQPMRAELDQPPLPSDSASSQLPDSAQPVASSESAANPLPSSSQSPSDHGLASIQLTAIFHSATAPDSDASGGCNSGGTPPGEWPALNPVDNDMGEADGGACPSAMSCHLHNMNICCVKSR